MERIRTQEDLRLERVTKRVKDLKKFYKHVGAYIIVNSVLLGINYFHLEPGEKFFQSTTFSTLFFWGIGLLIHAVRVFGKDLFFGSNWEERKLNEYMNQNEGQNSKWE